MLPEVPPAPPIEKVVEPPAPPGPPELEPLEHEGFVIAVFAPPPPPPPRELPPDPVDPCVAQAPIWVIGDPTPNVDIIPLLLISFPAIMAMEAGQIQR